MTTSDADLARIAARYPARPGAHRAWVALAAALAAVLLGWMTWAGLHHSNVAVSADVHGFRVTGDTTAEATLRVQRKDPSRAAVCTVQATAENFVHVGQRDVTIPPGSQEVTLFPTSLRTVNRATTVTVTGCRMA